MIKLIRNWITDQVVFRLWWQWRFVGWLSVCRGTAFPVTIYEHRSDPGSVLVRVKLNGAIHFIRLGYGSAGLAVNQEYVCFGIWRNNQATMIYYTDPETTETMRLLFWQFAMTGDRRIRACFEEEKRVRRNIRVAWHLHDRIFTKLELALRGYRGVSKAHRSLHGFVEEATWASRFTYPLSRPDALTDLTRVAGMNIRVGGQPSSPSKSPVDSTWVPPGFDPEAYYDGLNRIGPDEDEE